MARTRRLGTAVLCVGILLTLNVSEAENIDSTGPAVTLNNPCGVATDTAGNIYVADSGNNIIRKITPAGVVMTLAGTAGVEGHADGIGAAASFYLPTGITIDSSGNVYVADTLNNTIRKISSAGVVTTYAGTAGVTGHTDGIGTTASFSQPTGVVADRWGNVYVADTSNNTIRKITPLGLVTTFAGSAGMKGDKNGTSTAASFNSPSGVATDKAGNLYVADTNNSAIRKITPAGLVTTLAGTDERGHLDGVGAAATFDDPRGVATDKAGNVYVVDKENCNIRKITPAGRVKTLAGIPWESPLAEGVGVAGYANGVGLEASFWYPSGIATDNFGNIYVADTSNNAIRKITPAGVVTTLAGRKPDVPGKMGSQCAHGC